MNRATWIVAGLAVAAASVAVWGTSGSAAAAGSSARAGDAAEAWYSTLPVNVCSSPVGCPPVTPPTSRVYPAGTLHVAESGGQATATMYLQPDLSGLGAGVAPTGGTMTLPLATASGDGTVNAAAASMEACLATGPIADGTAGSTDEPPPTDCRVHAPVTVGAANFTVDLTPFVNAWNQGRPEYGIGFLPTTSSSDPSGTWHVAFDGRNAAGPSHISSTFELPPTAPPFSPPSPTVPFTLPVTPATTVPAIPEPVFFPATVTSVSVATVPAPLAAPIPTSSVPSRSGTAPITLASGHGFQYPEVMLLPFAFLAAILFILRLLTSDATPRRPRRAAS